tara:strand:- start:168 stop:611 length:444 start_codon:yes stop_codon:yes gene_type:complete
MAYRGKFVPKNIDKYDGNPYDITYRSLWERGAFRYLDMNPDVVKWGSETIVVPYRCGTDGRMHRYFPDLKVTFKTGVTLLVEIKPASQVNPPKVNKNSRKRRRYIKEVLTWKKNDSKWKAANEFAQDRGWVFDIWTEKTLRSMGIKV